MRTPSAARLQAGFGNQAALRVSRTPVIQRQKAPEPASPKFRALEEEDLVKRVHDYEAKGKKTDEATFLAIDDAYAERVKETGGKRLPGTAAPGKAGKPAVLLVDSVIAYEGEMLRPGFFNVSVDDQVYNCHSFTFLDARSTKLSTLVGLIRTAPAPRSPAEPPRGTTFVVAADLVRAGIHFMMGTPSFIAPRWLLDGEASTLLKQYRRLKPGEKAVRGDIAIYSTDGKDLPHSGKVIDVDAKGAPTRIKSKWGTYSLFEHAPGAVPPHYGTPSFWRTLGAGEGAVDAGVPRREPPDGGRPAK